MIIIFKWMILELYGITLNAHTGNLHLDKHYTSTSQVIWEYLFNSFGE